MVDLLLRNAFVITMDPETHNPVRTASIFQIQGTEFVKLDATEKTAVVFSAALIVAVILLLGSIALLFFAFAMAYYLGNVLESLSLGFCVIGAAVVIIALIFYSNRNRMVIQPIARFMANLILSKKEDGNK